MSNDSKVYCCNSCGRSIFYDKDLQDETTLWDLGEYVAKCFKVKSVINLDQLKRYDCSLHEGWYCCKFIVMRMTVDKFGTGDSLLVYSDSVTPIKISEEQAWREKLQQKLALKRKEEHKEKGQIKLGKKDYKSVIESSQLAGKLIVCKYGAIWCPPCRLMDSIFTQIDEEKLLPNVVFFEVDVDEEQELASQWINGGIPFFVFYFNGKQVHITLKSLRGSFCVEGGIEGALKKQQLVDVCHAVLRSAESGSYSVTI